MSDHISACAPTNARAEISPAYPPQQTTTQRAHAVTHHRGTTGAEGKYLGVRFFRATQGREEELVEYDTPETRVCLVVDGFGVWLVGEGGFIVGDLDEPGWMRTEFRADTLSQIRAALVRHAGRKRARRER